MIVRANQLAEQQNCPLILFGCSRGASTTLTSVLRLYANEPELLRNVKGVIVEAPFADIPSVLRFRFGKLEGLAVRLIHMVQQYRKDKPSPLDLANKLEWPPHIPLLIVHSRADGVVPQSSTLELVKALRAKNAPLRECELQFSSHSALPTEHNEDRATYKLAVDAFYEHVFAS
jgi:alpha-beta hydrolase superfamily lysophospholipase